MSFSSRIIRGGSDLPRFLDSLPDLNHAIAAETRDVMAEAREEARQEGFQIGRIEGYREGYAKGLQDGAREGAAEIQAKHESLIAAHRADVDQFAGEMAAFVSRVDAAIADWTAAAEERLAGLAVEIASRALNSELSQSRESILAIVREALHEAEHAVNVRVRINPMDVATLESHRQEIVDSISHIKSLEAVADPSITGGCCIESESGMIDARVETYLARLADQVRRAA